MSMVIPQSQHMAAIESAAAQGSYEVSIEPYSDGTAKRAWRVDIKGWGFVFLDRDGKVTEAWSAGDVHWSSGNGEMRRQMVVSIANRDPKMQERVYYQEGRDANGH